MEPLEKDTNYIDGVITTDKNGRVRKIDIIASQFIGWSQPEISGKMLHEILHIINEDTAEPLEIPVHKALNDGEIVGLSNNALLVSRDGTKKHISCRMIPVRCENDEITGSVIILHDRTDEFNTDKLFNENVELYFNLFDNSALCISITTIDGEVSLNKTFCDMLGYPQKELERKNWKDITHPDDITLSTEMVKSLIEDRINTVHFEKRFIHKNGTIIWADVNISLQHDSNGKPSYYLSTVNNITSRKEAEEKLRKSERNFRALIENSSDAISLIDKKGNVLYDSPAYIKMLGYSEEERIGKNSVELVHPSERKDIEKLFASLILNKGIVELPPIRVLHANGTWHWIEGVANNLLDDPDVNAIIVNFRDITQRKKVDEELAHSHKLMHYIIEYNKSAIAVHDKQLRYIYVSQRYLNDNDVKEKDVIGKHHYDVFPDLPQKWREVHQRALKGEVSSADDDLYVQDDGREVWTRWECRPWYEADGSIGGLIVYTEVITERKKAEEEIRNERQLLRTLIDNLPVSIYFKDRDGRKVIANHTDVSRIGFSSVNEVIGKTDLELFEGEIGIRGYNDDMNVINTGKPIVNKEEFFTNKDGSYRWSLASKFPLYDENGKVSGLVGIGRDITDQKKAQSTILKLTKSIEQSPLSVIITNTHGNIEYVNPKFYETTGYDVGEVIGKNPPILGSSEMPPEKYKDLWDTLSSGKVWQGEMQTRKKNGDLFWEWTVVTTIKNETGDVINYVAIKEDIMARKQMETELIFAKEKAEENDRLKSAFLANMSHEIRTPLNCILGFTELMADPDIENDQRIEYSKLIMTSGNNLLSVINDVLDISRIESGQVQLKKNIFPAQKIIRGIYNDFEKRALEQGIHLKISDKISKDEVLIESDEIRLKQVLTNFVTNALKFTEKGFIEIGLKYSGNLIQFYVRDTGIGIMEERQKDIFIRFRQIESAYTRKYGGNGLGLAISKSLVEMLGGNIGVESEYGKGSTFYFTLPVFDTKNGSL